MCNNPAVGLFTGPLPGSRVPGAREKKCTPESVHLKNPSPGTIHHFQKVE